jgi:HTH-type transcriptional regulator, transcriptional repressor of NAD biosynthesis genes
LELDPRIQKLPKITSVNVTILQRGLVIGKFLPPHNGHVALINFAKQHCDEVIVSMSYTDHDVIPQNKRVQWLEEIFKNDPKVKVHKIVDNFDHPELPLDKRTEEWARVISKVYPKIDLVVSSESYGDPFGKHLHAKHVSFDPDRTSVPISASAIRAKPLSNWQFLPAVVRPYFVRKICFYGAESTGKSTMAIKMSDKYKTIFVPEVAREMITSNDFTIDDIIKIGNAHLKRIVEATNRANKVLFCDTDVLTTQIYSRHYLSLVPPVLHDIEQQMKYDKYFLFDIDVPWVADDLRDLSGLRKEMHARFKDELVQRGIKYTMVSGSWEEREEIISTEVDKLLRDE